jgi:5-methylcytosine-specific restriction endonuclease McrA
MSKRSCLGCGADLAGAHGNRKRCESCNRDAHRKRMVARNRANGAHPTKVCERCGASFEAERSDQRWCSYKCRKTAYNASRLPPDHQVKCEFCGTLFTTRFKRQRFCAAKCQRADENVRHGFSDPRVPFDCACCGKGCVPGKNGVHSQARRFCSPGCKRAWHNAAARGTVPRRKRGPTRRIRKQEERAWVEGACPECGERFVRKQKQGLAIYCSRRCKVKVVQRNRRARKTEAFLERVFRQKVYERDNWCCQLCGEPTARTFDQDDPLSPVLDHVIPLARGGEHSYANIQLAHFICNSVKSDGAAVAIGEQVAMV